jgi:hypothetical protein
MDRQARQLSERQRALFAEADAAWARGNKARAMELERRASALASFYD